MKLSQYLVQKLIEYKVTDVFGIPGGVILDFIYELDKSELINVHLSFHEQAAAYAACGYAQSSGRLGVAYATKGPGMTNMITAMTEAYCDSLPVLFVTAHSQKYLNRELRIEEEQEIDHVALAASITKFSKRVETVEEAVEAIQIGCREAVSGRKGPVLLDFADKVLKSELQIPDEDKYKSCYKNESSVSECIAEIKNALAKSERPVFLIGDGVRSSDTAENIARLAKQLNIPMISSRFSQDVVSEYEQYFGYIGSHGLRYSNFIISKTDCIISLGNRLAFRIESESFQAVLKTAKIIRVDIDAFELKRDIPGSSGHCVDLTELFAGLAGEALPYKDRDWINVCHTLKEELKNYDVNPGIIVLSNLMARLSKDETIVCDIGNNELLASRAYAISGKGRKLLHSKSFKTVGSAIGKAIGAYYSTRKRVLCIVGDQGFQFNIQELQYVKSNALSIVFVICNNNASEMLKDGERRQGYQYALHTTDDSGYSHPDFQKVADAYGINYTSIHIQDRITVNVLKKEPQIIEVFLDDGCEVQQHLPKGYPCQMFVPEIDMDIYNYLNCL